MSTISALRTRTSMHVNDISVKDADIEEIIRRLYKQGVE